MEPLDKIVNDRYKSSLNQNGSELNNRVGLERNNIETLIQSYKNLSTPSDELLRNLIQDLADSSLKPNITIKDSIKINSSELIKTTEYIVSPTQTPAVKIVRMGNRKDEYVTQINSYINSLESNFDMISLRIKYYKLLLNEFYELEKYSASIGERNLSRIAMITLYALNNAKITDLSEPQLKAIKEIGLILSAGLYTDEKVNETNNILDKCHLNWLVDLGDINV
ncbi:hypothetical protein [Clostridium sp. DJ247]|uniref:hypothetical protein n=1 Tax=Clostridium sp. DJ247 TaxID=2726188 RepID=UPI00162AD291|nr:hypothetical protein [Clostridium sp. DJ247]MBC2579584.1 hypothetical protein [Clostridium sp. DJ247]